MADHPLRSCFVGGALCAKAARFTAAGVAALTLVLYLRALSCGFVNLDDPDYVVNNPLIRRLSFDTVVAAFTQAHVGWWMPLTWLSFAFDYHFWGLNPAGYHLTNILLHAVNAGLVVLIADRLLRKDPGGGEYSGESGWMYHGILLLAGLLWGIHPLRVESVAWVTERKDVLNGLFSLGAILSYLHYVHARVRNTGGAGLFFVMSLGLFALSLMAKSVSVVLPLMFLVADWFPFGRLRRGNIGQILAEKIPFLLLSTAMAVATVYFTAQSQYLVSYEQFPLIQRLVVSGNAVYEYCRLMLLPTGIVAFHVIPDPIPAAYAVTSLAVIAVSVAICFYRKHRWIAAVWLCFLIPLLPVLAILQNGDQSFASRFTYLPSVVPSIAIAGLLRAGFAKMTVSWRIGARLGVPLVAALLLALYGTMTIRLIGTWKDTETLWTRVVSVEPGAIVCKERGMYYYSIGNYPAAVADFSESLRMLPENWRPYRYNLLAFRGEALRKSGHYAESVDDFSAAIAQHPLPAYYCLRGLANEALGKRHEADEDFRMAGPCSGTLDWYWVRED